jgi:hypothetical protein
MEQEPKDVRLPVMVSRSDLEAIDGWRYANRVPTRAEAIRRLLELGLKTGPSGVTAKEVSRALIKDNDPATAHLVASVARELKGARRK